MPSRTIGHYPSDLTDAQWEHIRHVLPKAKHGGRPRTTNIRRVVNAIFFLNRTGCAWRYLPTTFPPWKTVHHYFCTWQKLGIWKKLNDRLVRRVRAKFQKTPFPTCTIVDSQSVRASHGSDRGYDGFKRLRGRKRQILVDTLGLLHSVRVHAADRADTQEAHNLYDTCPKRKLRSLRIIYADLGYRGRFVEETNRILGVQANTSRQTSKR